MLKLGYILPLAVCSYCSTIARYFVLDITPCCSPEQTSSTMSSRNFVQDVENQACAEICPIFCKNLVKSSSRRQRNLYDWAGQGCFLCLENPGEGHYAVCVPCIKPYGYRRVIGQSKIFTQNPEPIYEKVAPWETACEPDSEVWRRLVHECYRYQGMWKRWIPFYGIIEVQEVTVSPKANLFCPNVRRSS